MRWKTSFIIWRNKRKKDEEYMKKNCIRQRLPCRRIIARAGCPSRHGSPYSLDNVLDEGYTSGIFDYVLDDAAGH
jgi:hypothetical protein